MQIILHAFFYVNILETFQAISRYRTIKTTNQLIYRFKSTNAQTIQIMKLSLSDNDILYSLGIDYSSYSVPRLYKIFASDRVFRAQVLGTFREQLEEGSKQDDIPNHRTFGITFYKDFLI